MILYGSLTSPYVRHCRIALVESALPFEFIDTDYEGSAAGSPAQRVPFFTDGDTRLTDSSSILMHIRTAQGQAFLGTVEEIELYALANTAMDAAINLFLLERDGLGPEQSSYLSRQAARIESSLAALNEAPLSAAEPYTDANLRLLCFLDWALFRKRIDIAGLTNLEAILHEAQTWQTFSDTSPAAS